MKTKFMSTGNARKAEIARSDSLQIQEGKKEGGDMRAVKLNAKKV